MLILYNFVKSNYMSSDFKINSCVSLYRRGVDFAKKHVKAQTLDAIEIAASIAIPAALGAILSSGLLTNEFLLGAWILGCGISSKYTFERYLKIPQIEREIEEIVVRSQNKTKSALFVHSKQDHNGALSATHAITQVYQDCARHYSIDRIRGMDYEERLKVRDRKYDVVILIAHGQPNAVDMDGDFFSLNAGSSKKLGFLSCRIKNGGKIILSACRTGRGDENFAKAFSSYAPHATVYASSENIYVGVGQEFDPEMTPTFNDGIWCRGKNSTRVYQKGELVSKI